MERMCSKELTLYIHIEKSSSCAAVPDSDRVVFIFSESVSSETPPACTAYIEALSVASVVNIFRSFASLLLTASNFFLMLPEP